MKLGKKVKIFRKRAKMSQLELETEIEASPGSISRLENGLVSPTKETLNKIIKVLKIPTPDVLDIFEIDKSNLVSLLEINKILNSSFDTNIILANAANYITKELDIATVSTYLIKGDAIKACTYTNSHYNNKVNELLSVPFNSLSLSLKRDNKNLIVKAIREKSTQVSDVFEDFSLPTVNRRISHLLKQIVTFKAGIVFPLLSEGKALGAILYSKDYSSDFSDIKELLNCYTEAVSLSLSNAIKYNPSIHPKS